MKLFVDRREPLNNPASDAIADVVFLHGTGSNSQMWERQSEFLIARGYRSFLVDLRGHGKSPNPGGPCTIEHHSQDVLETLTVASLKTPAYFVGHSLGAIISVALAAADPNLCSAIFAASLPGKVISGLPLALRAFVRGPQQGVRAIALHKALAWRERTLFEMDAAVLDEIAKNFANIDNVEKPLPVECPVHFANGLWDPVAPYWYTVKMHRMLPGSTLKTFKLGGHNFMDAFPDETNKWLAEYL
jgi:pimeloyl-ACP methyl ester carboxylesterase